MRILFDLTTVLIVIISIHLWVSPFTKVEESFTIQAIHDILKYGVSDISKYDHIEFPGAVPRSFVGPLIIAGLTYPFKSTFETNPLRGQILARYIIGISNALALSRFITAAKRALSKTDGEDKKSTHSFKSSEITVWFGLFTATQFHLMFYSSRPLPNFVMALPLSLQALAWALEENYRWCLILLSFTAIVFRLELFALCGGVAIGCLFFKKLSLLSIVRTGFIGFGIGAFLSYQVDSYFWKYTTIPELESFIFNVINGQSSKWGVQPFFTYITEYLPMMFIPPTALFLNYLGMRLAPEQFTIVGLAAYFHVLVLSLQPHKEWRFIIYANPPITLLGSVSAAYLYNNMSTKSIKGVAVRFILLLTPLLSLIVSIAFSYISSLNYPGGYALQNFNEYLKTENITNVTVHLDVPVCMTGATLFGQLNESYNVTYDKTEGHALFEKWQSFDYLITSQSTGSDLPSANGTEWELIQSTQKFSGINTEFLMSTFENKYAHGLDLLFTWQKEGNLDFLYDIWANSIVKKDVIFTYKKVQIT